MSTLLIIPDLSIQFIPVWSQTLVSKRKYSKIIRREICPFFSRENLCLTKTYVSFMDTSKNYVSGFWGGIDLLNKHILSTKLMEPLVQAPMLGKSFYNLDAWSANVLLKLIAKISWYLWPVHQRVSNIQQLLRVWRNRNFITVINDWYH